MNERITIIGDGQMGIVLAQLHAEAGRSVTLWGPFPEQIEQLSRDRESPIRLPGFRIDPEVRMTPDASEALVDADVVVDAIPTQFIRATWGRFYQHVPADAIIVSVSKGIEQKTLLRPLQIVAESLGESKELDARGMVCLSGPTIASELARRLPATMVAASTTQSARVAVQEMFAAPYLRVYTNDDVVGVEIAGAVKNVIAIAAGMVDGMELGHNAKSALLTRGLAEIARLGTAMGAHRETFFGVAGVGDLATTCFSPYGRNRTCGEALGRGVPLDEHLQSTASVVEGVQTTRSVMQLAEHYRIDMPISRAVHAILFEGLAPRDAIHQLMERELKSERIG